MIFEWQLWMYPQPIQIGRGRRLNPALVRYGRIFQDGDDLVRVKDLFERRRTPPQLKRCVRAVAKKHGGDVSKAFAICTASLQRKGYLEPGSQMPTKSGAKAGRSKAADKEHKAKVAEYEQLLALARKKRRSK